MRVLRNALPSPAGQRGHAGRAALFVRRLLTMDAETDPIGEVDKPRVRQRLRRRHAGRAAAGDDERGDERHEPARACHETCTSSFVNRDQVLDAVLGDDDVVLDADAEAAVEVDARLDGDDVAGRERVGALGGEARRLVHVEAEPVAEPVAEGAREAAPSMTRARRRPRRRPARRPGWRRAPPAAPRGRRRTPPASRRRARRWRSVRV